MEAFVFDLLTKNQKVSQSLGVKIKKELSIFVKFEARYGQNKSGGKIAAPCII